MMRLTYRARLFQTVGDNFCRGDQSGVDFLFVFVVRANCCDKGTGPDILFAHEEFVRSCAGDTYIALPNCTCQILNKFDVDL